MAKARRNGGGKSTPSTSRSRPALPRPLANGHVNGSHGASPVAGFGPDPILLNKLGQLAANATSISADGLRNGTASIGDPRRSVEDECGYPPPGSAVSVELYKFLYDRCDVANRAVQLMPKECWGHSPSVYETDDRNAQTPFEADWDALGSQLDAAGGASFHTSEEGSRVWEHLYQADVLSRIGSFGLLLVGVDDGKNLQEPVDGLVTLNWRDQPIRRPTVNRLTGRLEFRQVGVRRAFERPAPVAADSLCTNRDRAELAALQRGAFPARKVWSHYDRNRREHVYRDEAPPPLTNEEREQVAGWAAESHRALAVRDAVKGALAEGRYGRAAALVANSGLRGEQLGLTVGDRQLIGRALTVNALDHQAYRQQQQEQPPPGDPHDPSQQPYLPYPHIQQQQQPVADPYQQPYPPIDQQQPLLAAYATQPGAPPQPNPYTVDPAQSDAVPAVAPLQEPLGGEASTAAHAATTAATDGSEPGQRAGALAGQALQHAMQGNVHQALQAHTQTAFQHATAATQYPPGDPLHDLHRRAADAHGAAAQALRPGGPTANALPPQPAQRGAPVHGTDRQYGTSDGAMSAGYGMTPASYPNYTNQPAPPPAHQLPPQQPPHQLPPRPGRQGPPPGQAAPGPGVTTHPQQAQPGPNGTPIGPPHAAPVATPHPGAGTPPIAPPGPAQAPPPAAATPPQARPGQTPPPRGPVTGGPGGTPAAQGTRPVPSTGQPDVLPAPPPLHPPGPNGQPVPPHQQPGLPPRQVAAGTPGASPPGGQAQPMTPGAPRQGGYDRAGNPSFASDGPPTGAGGFQAGSPNRTSQLPGAGFVGPGGSRFDQSAPPNRDGLNQPPPFYAGRMAGTDLQYYGVQLGGSEFPAASPPPEQPQQRRRVIFLNAYDESLVQVVRYEWNVNNPRFGMPVMYRVTLNDPREAHSGIGLPMATVFVHWTRVIHLADRHANAASSKIFAPPVLRPILNRCLDMYKVPAAAAEGYWQTGTPTRVFETHPQLGGDVLVNEGELRDQVENLINSLQKVLTGRGGSWKLLAPQMVDPSPFQEGLIELIAIQLGCPVRVFKGSERGELASTQDDSDWNGRVAGRMNNYLTPKMICPFVDRLIALGVLTRPAEYRVEWPDLESLSDKDKAAIFQQLVAALAAAMQGNLFSMFDPHTLLTKFTSGLFTDEEVDAMLQAGKEYGQEAADLQSQQLAQQMDLQSQQVAGQADLTKQHMDAMQSVGGQHGFEVDPSSYGMLDPDQQKHQNKVDLAAAKNPMGSQHGALPSQVGGPGGPGQPPFGGGGGPPHAGPPGAGGGGGAPLGGGGGKGGPAAKGPPGAGLSAMAPGAGLGGLGMPVPGQAAPPGGQDAKVAGTAKALAGQAPKPGGGTGLGKPPAAPKPPVVGNEYRLPEGEATTTVYNLRPRPDFWGSSRTFGDLELEEFRSTVANFDPAEARDERGRWTAGAGPGIDPLPPGTGLVKTASVEVAVRALIAGRKVELDQPREVGTLIAKLYRLAQAAKRAGKDAPNIDLCNVSVPGTNLFCAASKGIPRAQMPQLGGIPVKGSVADRTLPKNAVGGVDIGPAFVAHLRARGVRVDEGAEDVSFLKASQNEVNGIKVAAIMHAMETGGAKDASPLFISREGYVIDGHHRWAAVVGVKYDKRDAALNVPVYRVDMPILDVLKEANSFAAGMGLPSMGWKDSGGLTAKLLTKNADYGSGPRLAWVRDGVVLTNFDPSQERDEHGRWGGGGFPSRHDGAVYQDKGDRDSDDRHFARMKRRADKARAEAAAARKALNDKIREGAAEDQHVAALRDSLKAIDARIAELKSRPAGAPDPAHLQRMARHDARIAAIKARLKEITGNAETECLLDLVANYNPDEPRDPRGEWTSGGGGQAVTDPDHPQRHQPGYQPPPFRGAAPHVPGGDAEAPAGGHGPGHGAFGGHPNAHALHQTAEQAEHVHDATEVAELLGGGHHEAAMAVQHAHDVGEAGASVAHLTEAGAIVAPHLYGAALKGVTAIMQHVPGARRVGHGIADLHDRATKAADAAVKKIADRYGHATTAAILGAGGFAFGAGAGAAGAPLAKALPATARSLVGAVPLLAVAEAGKRLGAVGPDSKLEQGLHKVGTWVHAVREAVGRPLKAVGDAAREGVAAFGGDLGHATGASQGPPPHDPAAVHAGHTRNEEEPLYQFNAAPQDGPLNLSNEQLKTAWEELVNEVRRQMNEGDLGEAAEGDGGKPNEDEPIEVPGQEHVRDPFGKDGNGSPADLPRGTIGAPTGNFDLSFLKDWGHV